MVWCGWNEEVRLAKKIVNLDVGGVRFREKSRWSQLDSAKGVLNEWLLSVEQGRMIVCGRNN